MIFFDRDDMFDRMSSEPEQRWYYEQRSFERNIAVVLYGLRVIWISSAKSDDLTSSEIR